MTELVVRHELVISRRTPYPDMDVVTIQEGAIGVDALHQWQISNRGGLVMLSNTDPRLPRSWIGEQVVRTRDRAPAVSNIMRYTKNGEEKLVTMPIVETAQACQRALFADMGTAGIYPYQTNTYQTDPDTGRTPLPLFLYLVNQAKKLPVSVDPNIFPHDMLLHWLGAAGQEPKSFKVFQGLYQQHEGIRQEFGEDAQKAYMESLGQGFDVSTGTMLRNISDTAKSDQKYPYLLGKTVTALSKNCRIRYPQVFEQSRKFIADLGFGMPIIRPELGREYIVPEELVIGPAHYARVNEALHQAPWIPPKSA